MSSSSPLTSLPDSPHLSEEQQHSDSEEAEVPQEVSSSVLPPHPAASSVALPASRLPTYYSVEYPGYVQSHPSSLAYALRTLGGQKALNDAFSEGGRILELKLQPDNPFAHPITGDVVNTNKLLVKVTRRKKRDNENTGAGTMNTHGIEGVTLDKGKGKEAQPEEEAYSAEVVGVIPKTIRFRSMADFQYQPDEDDYVVQMRHAMDRLDVDAIRSFEFKPLKENYGGARPAQSSDATEAGQMDAGTNATSVASSTSTPNLSAKSQLQLIPPPLFSRQGIPQHYNLKQNPMSVIHTTVDPKTGEEIRRYIHKHRIKGSLAPAAISWDTELVPTEPPPQILEAKSQAKPHLLNKLKDLFAQRPVWSRVALINQFPPLEGREIHNTRVHIGLVAYTFSDGAWRDTLLRLGYDPRKDAQARFYQRVYFRNTANEDARRKSIVGRRVGGDTAPEVAETPNENRNSHIFDGKTLHAGAASFQLCDITDPLLVPLINDETALRKEPDIADGWYSSHEFSLIKAVVRRKHFNLIQGKVISDKDCADLFVPGGLARSSSNAIPRAGPSGQGKKYLRKAKSNRRPVAPEKLMAAELEIALRKDAENARASRAPEKGIGGSAGPDDAMEEDE